MTNPVLNNRVLFKKGLFPIKVSDFCVLFDSPFRLVNLNPNAIITCLSCETGYNPLLKDSLIIERSSDAIMIKRIGEGCLAVLTDHEIEGIPCIVVDDLYSVVFSICKWMYKEINLPSIIISGSTGKTTTKRMINDIMEKQISVFSTNKNSNILIEFCCNLQSVKPTDQITVWEVDEGNYYNTELIPKILKPSIAVFTNVGDSHLGHIGSKEKQINNIRKLTSGMDENGIVIINSDDKESTNVGFDKNIVTIGINDTTADCIAFNIKQTRRGTTFDVRFQNDEAHITLRVFGIHNIYDAMMAYVVGVLQGVNKKDILKALKNYRNVGYRQNILRNGGVVLYADCYNASAVSVSYAIRCFCDLPNTHGKKIAILGDIAEIEGYEEKTYREIANAVDNSTIDILLTYGKDSVMIHKYMKKDLLKKHFSSQEELNQFLIKLKKKGKNSYLFKASRSMELEHSIKVAFPIHYYKMRTKEKMLRSHLWK